MTPDQVKERMWAEASSTLFVTKEQFLASFEGCAFEPMGIGGEVSMVAIIKGPEFHFYSLQTGRTLPLGAVRKRLREIVEEHGFVTTRTPIDEDVQHRVNKLLGWVEVDRDEYDVHYRTERIGSCRSSP